ncbi:hypothetical protein ST47_g9550 [Ascochyta rabiei]|uniref:Uncharacterized protein n=1 Tax=Didymella rabiei TaxID=5454 RepID=A0A162X2E2_DIDRA|nr:hypothetical protein ST47_g9550 [Ascochyta rabiei]
MAVPNVGDLLMMSQVAWQTGRAFTAGRKDAPTEFQAVETDIAGLSEALKQLAETLHAEANDSLISRSDRAVQHGVALVVATCQRTIHDLDSLVNRYQVIRKHRTVGGFAIERSWSDLVLTQYETILWTTEGGNTKASVCHVVQKAALTQCSNSLEQLENAVTPMANRFDSMHLDDELDDVSRFIRELAIANHSRKAPLVPRRNLARSPAAEAPDPLNATLVPLFPLALSPRQTTSNVASPLPHQRSVSTESSTSKSVSNDVAAAPAACIVQNPRTPPRKRVSEFSFGGSSARDSTSSYASSTSSGPSRNSLNSRHALVAVSKSPPLLGTPELGEPVQVNTGSLSLLPPPALRPPSTHSTRTMDRKRSNSTLSAFPAQQNSITKLHCSSTTASQKSTFEKEAFRNSAVLCDVRGRIVEYSQLTVPDPDYPSGFADIEMVEACDSCRIAVVRKRTTDPTTKIVRVVTSIWAFSDDNNVRVELKMEDDEMYIPYLSYFSPAKVSMTVACELRFHDVRYGNRLIKTAKTTWVNYVFEDAQAAALFQNEIMGRSLLATFRTSKTMRIHEGTLASFAYAEQMCALENLRVWEDTDTDAIIGLIHFSASFRAGYLAFYLNSSTHPVKVQSVSGREVKIKGLKVPIAEAGRAMRKDSVVDDAEIITEACEADRRQEEGSGTSEGSGSSTTKKGKGKGKGKRADVDRKKVISGVKIEFATEMEKREFLDLVAEYQRPERLCELPDLMGVN